MPSLLPDFAAASDDPGGLPWKRSLLARQAWWWSPTPREWQRRPHRRMLIRMSTIDSTSAFRV
jgi:hypothetical protein